MSADHKFVTQKLVYIKQQPPPKKKKSSDLPQPILLLSPWNGKPNYFLFWPKIFLKAPIHYHALSYKILQCHNQTVCCDRNLAQVILIRHKTLTVKSKSVCSHSNSMFFPHCCTAMTDGGSEASWGGALPKIWARQCFFQLLWRPLTWVQQQHTVPQFSISSEALDTQPPHWG